MLLLVRYCFCCCWCWLGTASAAAATSGGGGGGVDVAAVVPDGQMTVSGSTGTCKRMRT